MNLKCFFSFKRTISMLRNLKNKQGEGDERGWDGWMASPTGWTWVWASCGSWWWIGKPGPCCSPWGSRVEHDWATELNWHRGWQVKSITSKWDDGGIMYGTGILNLRWLTMFEKQATIGLPYTVGYTLAFN